MKFKTLLLVGICAASLSLTLAAYAQNSITLAPNTKSALATVPYNLAGLTTNTLTLSQGSLISLKPGQVPKVNIQFTGKSGNTNTANIALKWKVAEVTDQTTLSDTNKFETREITTLFAVGASNVNVNLATDLTTGLTNNRTLWLQKVGISTSANETNTAGVSATISNLTVTVWQ